MMAIVVHHDDECEHVNRFCLQHKTTNMLMYTMSHLQKKGRLVPITLQAWR